MAIAIKTKFLAPTRTKMARVKASSCNTEERSSVTVNWDHSRSPEQNHAEAAKVLAERLDWPGEWHLADGGEVYLFVRVGQYSKMFNVADASEQAKGE